MEKTRRLKNKNILETLIYAYIRKIKKWMFCPACQHGKMSINKKSTLWTDDISRFISHLLITKTPRRGLGENLIVICNT